MSSSPLLSPSSFVGRRLLFNFLGTFGSQEEENDGAPWRFAFDPIVDATWNSARNSRSHDLIFDGIVVDGKLSFNFSFCPAIDAKEGAERLASGFKENLVGIVAAAGAQEHFWQQQISALRDAAELPEEVEGHGREARGLVQALGGAVDLERLRALLKGGADSRSARSPGAETLTMAAAAALLGAASHWSSGAAPTAAVVSLGEEKTMLPLLLQWRPSQLSEETKGREEEQPPYEGAFSDCFGRGGHQVEVRRRTKKTADPEKKQIDH